MSMAFSPSNLIGMEGSQNSIIGFTPNEVARMPGPITTYEYKNTKEKKQLKEIRKVLSPEKKKFLFIKYGFKFNVRHRCVVCGAYHEWEASDTMRPPIPLSEVHKGRPLKGTYCPKHASMYIQMETLEQQILANNHGLEFKKYIPKAKVPKMMQRGPLTDLSPADVTTLVSAGWVVEPPKGTKETPHMQYTRIMLEVQGKLSQIQKIIPLIEVEENGEK